MNFTICEERFEEQITTLVNKVSISLVARNGWWRKRYHNVYLC